MVQQKYVWLCYHGIWDDKYVGHVFGSITTAKAVHRDIEKTSEDTWQNTADYDSAVSVERVNVIRRASKA